MGRDVGRSREEGKMGALFTVFTFLRAFGVILLDVVLESQLNTYFVIL